MGQGFFKEKHRGDNKHPTHTIQDALFIKQELAALRSTHQTIQTGYNDYAPDSVDSYLYLAPEIKEGIKQFKTLLENTTNRINALTKIQNNQPITKDEKKLLLQIPEFHNSIIERYANVIDDLHPKI